MNSDMRKLLKTAAANFDNANKAVAEQSRANLVPARDLLLFSSTACLLAIASHLMDEEDNDN